MAQADTAALEQGISETDTDESNKDPESVFETARALVNDATGIAAEGADLLALDTELAVASLVKILMLAIIASVLAVASWTGLVIAFALWLMDASNKMIGVFTLVTLINAGLCVLSYMAINSLRANLAFRATRAQLHACLAGGQEESTANGQR